MGAVEGGGSAYVFYHFFQCEKVALDVLCLAPTKEEEEVEQGGGEYVLLLVCGKFSNGAMAFAELLGVFVNQKPNMGELRRLPAKGVV